MTLQDCIMVMIIFENAKYDIILYDSWGLEPA